MSVLVQFLFNEESKVLVGLLVFLASNSANSAPIEFHFKVVILELANH
jgi:hypothetical protein